jgi:hypothetical protein
MTKSLNEMTQITQLTFNAAARLFEDFNLPAKSAEAADAPPAEPAFTVAELSTARQEAWNDGYLAAAASNSHILGRDGQRIFAELLARADDIDKGLELMAERNAAAIARWLAAAFVTALPNLSDGSMAGRTSAVMDLLRAALRSQSKIELHGETGTAVSFRNMHDVCRQIESQQTDEPTDGSIVIAWQQGEAEINPTRTWEEIRTAIMPLAAGEAAETSLELRITQEESMRHVG